MHAPSPRAVPRAGSRCGAGSFKTDGADYAWTMQIVDEAWADPSMKLAVLQITGDSDAALEAVESQADVRQTHPPVCPKHVGLHVSVRTAALRPRALPRCPQALRGGTCEVLGPRDETKMEPGYCYTLTPDPDVYSAVFRLNLASAGYTAFFAEHVPTEFERSAHYFIDKNGVDIEPLHELPEAEEAHAEYGGVIAACIVVNLCTLIGLLTMLPGIKGVMENPGTQATWLAGSSAFAAGALLAAAAFLMIPECTRTPASHCSPVNRDHAMLDGGRCACLAAVLLVNADEDLSEGAASARLGVCLLVGFAVGLVVDVVTSSASSGTTVVVSAPKPDEEIPAVAAGKSTDVATLANVQARTAISIFVGDFLHNMGDGFFIGAAFKVCGTSMGWTVAWGAFAHELAQELADFFVLVGPASMVPWKAIVLNVVSGTGVILGGIIVTATDVSNTATGLILVFGAGVYVYIGCVEAAPRAFTPTTSRNHKLLALGLFILGAAGIGFVLFGHEHCEGEGGHAH